MVEGGVLLRHWAFIRPVGSNPISSAVSCSCLHVAKLFLLKLQNIINKSLYKKVVKIDKYSKKIIKIYSSISEAEKENGNTKHISDVYTGKRKTCKGYIWQYIN